MERDWHYGEDCGGRGEVEVMKKVLVLCTTDSMIWNFLVPHIKDLKNDGYDVECACAETGKYYNELEEKYGFKMNKIQFARSPYKKENINAYLKLKNLVKKKKYDIIFCHEPVGGAMGRIVGKKYGCYVIYMAHGFHFYKGAGWSSIIYYIVEKTLSKRTDCLVTINHEDYSAATKFYAKKTILLHGIGVDISKFIYDPNGSYIRKELNLDDSDTILLSVGELIKRKNHESVIKAIGRLKNKKLHYVIVGEGELREYLLKLTQRLRIEKQIHFLGFRKDVNKLCNSADIFIMPSLQEGLSVALMEAMACGRPIIASKIRGNIDLIKEKEGGILVDAKSVKDYEKAIKYMIKNREIAQKMGKYNLSIIRQFDIETVRKEMKRVFIQ